MIIKVFAWICVFVVWLAVVISVVGGATSGVVDYDGLKTNRGKLEVVYQMIEQARLIHNREGAKVGKEVGLDSWYVYAQRSERDGGNFYWSKVGELLREQNRLRLEIRRGVYSDKAWMKLSDEEQEVFALRYYGDKGAIVANVTINTTFDDSCGVLGMLRSVGVGDISVMGGPPDPLENFTTYDEVDADGDLTVTSSRITFDTLRRDAETYVRCYKGEDYFIDFEHLVAAQMGVHDNLSYVGVWGISDGSNTIDDMDTNDEGLALIHRRTSGGDYMLFFKDYENDGNDRWYGADPDDFWYTISRDDNTAICKVYSDSLRETLEDTLTFTSDTKSYDNVYGLVGWSNDNHPGVVCSGYVENLDLQVVGVPGVLSSAATGIGVVTATLNGEVEAISDSSISERGFVWDSVSRGMPDYGTSPAESIYAYDWTEEGSFGVSSFNHAIGSLSSATKYYFRAAAENDNGYWGYGGELSFLTKPAVPTGVSASDGAHTDKVVVSWTECSGNITGYKIYRDGELIDTVGEVSSYDDVGADAPTITAGSSVAGEGTYTDRVSLSISGESANVGTTHSYKVRAYNGAGESGDSNSDGGYVGVGGLSFQWQRSSGDSDGGYGNISGATVEAYNDYGAPSPSVIGGNGSACDGCSGSYVVLSVVGESGVDGDGRYYRCVLEAEGASQNISGSDRGYRGTDSLSYQWYRSNGDGDSGYSIIAGGNGDPYNDVDGVFEPDGRYYRCVVSMDDAESSNSTSDRGYMESVTVDSVVIYPNWATGFTGVSDKYYVIVFAGGEPYSGANLSWNSSGVGGIEWCENVTGGDGKADCVILSSEAGNQTLCCSVVGYNLSDCGVKLWTVEAESYGVSVPWWYFIIVAAALGGAFYTKELIMYIMAIVGCAGGIWWVNSSDWESLVRVFVSVILILLISLVVTMLIRKGGFLHGAYEDF